MKALLIGDVAGHCGALRRALGAHGVDTTQATIPDGLIVVQVGDLVHRGPQSAEVVALVDRFLRGRAAGQWIQLVGNHEQPYVFDPPGVIDRELDAESVRTLRGWWTDGLAQVAVAISPDWSQVRLPRRFRSGPPAGDVLITHAGLTHGAWLALGRPATAAAAAAALDVDARGPGMVTLREGRMTTGTIDHGAGPLWAEAGAELLTSWDQTSDAPHLNQVHGHTTVRCWAQERWWPGAAAIINRGSLLADQDTKQEIALIGDRLMWGIDPGHQRLPTPHWQPLLIPLRSSAPTAPSTLDLTEKALSESPKRRVRRARWGHRRAPWASWHRS